MTAIELNVSNAVEATTNTIKKPRSVRNPMKAMKKRFMKSKSKAATTTDNIVDNNTPRGAAIGEPVLEATAVVDANPTIMENVAATASRAFAALTPSSQPEAAPEEPTTSRDVDVDAAATPAAPTVVDNIKDAASRAIAAITPAGESDAAEEPASREVEVPAPKASLISRVLSPRKKTETPTEDVATASRDMEGEAAAAPSVVDNITAAASRAIAAITPSNAAETPEEPAAREVEVPTHKPSLMSRMLSPRKQPEARALPNEETVTEAVKEEAPPVSREVEVESETMVESITNAASRALASVTPDSASEEEPASREVEVEVAAPAPKASLMSRMFPSRKAKAQSDTRTLAEEVSAEVADEEAAKRDLTDDTMSFFDKIKSVISDFFAPITEKCTSSSRDAPAPTEEVAAEAAK